MLVLNGIVAYTFLQLKHIETKGPKLVRIKPNGSCKSYNFVELMRIHRHVQVSMDRL